jgi:hypothetical protein
VSDEHARARETAAEEAILKSGHVWKSASDMFACREILVAHCARIQALEAEVSEDRLLIDGDTRIIDQYRAHIEALEAARAKANNEWRLDYNKCAAERDAQYARAEALEAALRTAHQAIYDGLPEAALIAIDAALSPKPQGD